MKIHLSPLLSNHIEGFKSKIRFISKVVDIETNQKIYLKHLCMSFINLPHS